MAKEDYEQQQGRVSWPAESEMGMGRGESTYASHGGIEGVIYWGCRVQQASEDMQPRRVGLSVGTKGNWPFEMNNLQALLRLCRRDP